MRSWKLHRPARVAGAAALAVLVATAAGCRSSRGGPVNTYRGEEGVHQLEEQLGSKALAQDLQMEDVRSKRENGLLVVQFELHNTKQVDLPIEWTVNWFDESGMKIAWDRPWKPLVLPGKGYETIQIVAPTPAATSFKPAYRRPHPVR